MRFSLKKLMVTLSVLLAVVCMSSPASAQFGGFGGMGGGFGGMGGGFGGMGGGFGMMGGGFGMMGGMMGGGFGGMGGMMGCGGMAGVEINPKGVLERKSLDPTGALTRKMFDAAKVKAKDFARSPMRKVSLNRLEAAVKTQVMEKLKLPTHEMICMAGLTRIEYVFFLPETNDIVVAGPAEPYFFGPDREARGVDSGEPTIYLHDVIAAMRAYPPGGRGVGTIGCSIDPTQEGLQKMQDFVNQVAKSGQPPNAAFIVNGIREAMGMQDVSVTGVSPKTHFAQVLVAADYRMKLIGIGEERVPVKIPSYVSLVSGGRSSNALVRWYFTPDYEMVRVTEDGLGMQLVGEGVKLVGADEVVRADGTRIDSGTSDGASKRFCAAFTKMYPELAKREPVYAQLRDMIDISVAVAYIQQQDFYGKAGWTPDTFLNEDIFPIEIFHAPKQVETVVTAVRKGNRLMTPTGGGVNIQPLTALKAENLLKDDNAEVHKKRVELDLKDLPEGTWWWD